MGINGLWKILEPATESHTLNGLNVLAGYSSTSRNKVLRVGVDMSTIMNECVAAEKAAHMYRYKVGGALRIFFFKLCKFLRESPSIFIFVFDGPQRPAFKHGKVIDTHSMPEWAPVCKELIDAFGFHWHEAPGEAEAELGWLNQINAVDVVLTSDSDAFAFGAQYVLRSIPSSSFYKTYSMGAIESDKDNIRLSQSKILLISMLSKTDYSNGLDGCGITLSYGLSQCGFGELIIRAYRELSNTPASLAHQLSSIAAQIRQELMSNSHGHLNSAHPSIAAKLNDNYFLSSATVSAYIRPITSSIGIEQARARWTQREPVLPRISTICITSFHWAQEILPTKFRQVLWPGILLRMLISPVVIYDKKRLLALSPYVQSKVTTVSKPRKRKEIGSWTRLTMSTDNLVAILSTRTSSQSASDTIRIWISTDFLPIELKGGVASSVHVNEAGPSSTSHRSLLDLLDSTDLDTGIVLSSGDRIDNPIVLSDS